MPRIDSPVRRVLEDKTPNASLKIRGKTLTISEHIAARQAPVPPKQSAMPQKFSPNPKTGQKRRIEEVEDNEEPMMGDTQISSSTQSLSQTTNLFSDAASDREQDSTPSELKTRSATVTNMTSFPASQDGPAPMELQFEIQEEMSQRTLDKMHAVALPQNQSQLIPPLRPNLIKETSQLSVSLSSLIDFDHSDSSQDEDRMDMIEEAKVPTEQATEDDRQIRRTLLDEKAETLRTRLQLALYKVQTNQTSRPFSRLNVLSSKSSSPNLPMHSFSSSVGSRSYRNESSSHPLNSPESRIAIARARATMQPKPAVRPLESLKVPQILPTSFSARWNEGTTEQTPPQQELSSSPPVGDGSELRMRSMQPRDGTTPSPPTKHRHHHHHQQKRRKDVPRTPMQLSSPPGSEAGEDTTTSRASGDVQQRHHHNNNNNARFKSSYGNVTSSAVKGEAANGLLELMRGAGAGAGTGEV